jgi:hypothetical protein
MTDWGLSNAHLEAWDFGRDGWSNERVAAYLTVPFRDAFVARALAWMPGAEVPVTAACVHLIPPDRPTQDELDAFLETQRERIREKIVLVFKQTVVPINFSPPTLVLRNEDFGRLARMLQDGFPVEMEVQIVNRTYPEGRTAYNVIAEIPGTDKRDEVVILGAHIDSMHGATGATDNASGVAVMMEAARILIQIGAQPRRTIRVALWGGEEQGLLGSQAYVGRHFGMYESPGPEYSWLAAYFNLDAGTGRVRGLQVFGSQAAADVLSQIVAPFHDDGVAGAIPSSSRRLSSSDYTSFWVAGLPGITLQQDPIEYFTANWHTDLRPPPRYQRPAPPPLRPLRHAPPHRHPCTRGSGALKQRHLKELVRAAEHRPYALGLRHGGTVTGTRAKGGCEMPVRSPACDGDGSHRVSESASVGPPAALAPWADTNS